MGLFQQVLVYMGDLYLVLPPLICLAWVLVVDNGATSKFDDVLFEHGGLLHVLPLAVHLKFFGGQVGGTILSRIKTAPELPGPIITI